MKRDLELPNVTFEVLFIMACDLRCLMIVS